MTGKNLPSDSANAPTLPPAPSNGTTPEQSGVDSDETLGWSKGDMPVDGVDGLPREFAEHPRYRVTRKLGSGGMGDVFLAEHRVMMRPVAIKTIRPAFLSNDQAIERFHREIRAAAALAHPNIVTAFDAEQAGNLHFLVMEYVEGVDLAQWLRDNGPPTFAKACHYIRQAALGLQHAHEKGLAHRDVKPHNLILTGKNQVKILDFGLARLGADNPSTEGLTAVGSYMGTADYIAPEQASDARLADIRSDIYSLGCTFFQLLTGRPPFEGGTNIDKIVKHCNNDPPAIADFRSGVPAEIVDIVAKMMAKDAANRYQQPIEVAKAIEPILRALTTKGAELESSGTMLARPMPSDSANKQAVKAKPSSHPSATAIAQPKPAPAKVKSQAIRVRRKRIPWGKWIGAAAGAAALLYFVVALFFTSQGGTVVFETDDPEISVLVMQGDKVVEELAARLSAKYRLPEGEYQLRAKNGRPGFDVEPRTLVVKRGEVASAAVRLQPPPAAAVLPPPIAPAAPKVSSDVAETAKDAIRRRAEFRLPPLPPPSTPPPTRESGPSVRLIREGSLQLIAEAPRDTAKEWIKTAYGANRVVHCLHAHTVGGKLAFMAFSYDSRALGRVQADFDLTAENIAARCQERKKAGMRPRGITAYVVNGQARFAVIWGMFGRENDFEILVDQSVEDIKRMTFGTRGNQALQSIQGYTRDGRDLYIAFKVAEGNKIDRFFDYGWRNDFAAGLESSLTARPPAWPVDISMWNHGKQRRFCVALRDGASPGSWSYNAEVPADRLEEVCKTRIAAGYTLKNIASNEHMGAVRYSMLWIHRPNPTNAEESPKPDENKTTKQNKAANRKNKGNRKANR